MKLTSTNLDILESSRNADFSTSDLPLALYSKYYINELISSTDPNQVISEFTGQIAFEIKQTSTLKEMQKILNNLTNFFLKRVRLEIEESAQLSESLLLFCDFLTGITIPDSELICNFCLLIFDQAHFLVYGQRIPELLSVLQEEIIQIFFNIEEVAELLQTLLKNI